jgi:hypothetical protein
MLLGFHGNTADCHKFFFRFLVRIGQNFVSIIVAGAGHPSKSGSSPETSVNLPLLHTVIPRSLCNEYRPSRILQVSYESLITVEINIFVNVTMNLTSFTNHFTSCPNPCSVLHHFDICNNGSLF